MVIILIGIFELFELRSLVVRSRLSCTVRFAKGSVDGGQSACVISTTIKFRENEVAHGSDTIFIRSNDLLRWDRTFELLFPDWTVFWKVLSHNGSCAHYLPVLHGYFSMRFYNTTIFVSEDSVLTVTTWHRLLKELYHTRWIVDVNFETISKKWRQGFPGHWALSTCARVSSFQCSIC